MSKKESRKEREERRRLSRSGDVTGPLRGEILSGRLPNLEKVKKYITAGADLEKPYGHYNETIIFGAMNPSYRQSKDVVNTLLAGGAKLNHKSILGNTALESLIEWGRGHGNVYGVLECSPHYKLKTVPKGAVLMDDSIVFEEEHDFVARILKSGSPNENWTTDAVKSRYQSMLLAKAVNLPIEMFIKDTYKPDPEHWATKYTKLNTICDEDGKKIGDRSSEEAAKHIRDMIVDMGRGFLYPALYGVLGGKNPKSREWAEDIFSKFIVNALFAKSQMDNTEAIALPKLLEMANRWDRNRNIINQERKDHLMVSWDALTPTVCGPNGYYLVPLTDTVALTQEGEVLSHCVGGYKSDCLTKGYQIYGVRRDKNTCEYTAGYKFGDKGDLVCFSRPFGYKNKTASPEAKADCEWFQKNVMDGKWGDFNKKRDSILNAASVRSRTTSVYIQDAGYNPAADDASERAQNVWKAWATSMDDLLRHRKKPLSELLEKGFYKNDLSVRAGLLVLPS